MLISHKRLLEWNPSENTNNHHRNDMTGYVRTMWFAPIFAAATAIVILFSNPITLTIAGPFLIIWLISPLDRLPVQPSFHST